MGPLVRELRTSLSSCSMVHRSARRQSFDGVPHRSIRCDLPSGPLSLGPFWGTFDKKAAPESDLSI